MSPNEGVDDAPGRVGSRRCGRRSDGGGQVRWDELFRDLEAQLEAGSAAELAAEVADRTRREAALLGLADRVAAAAGRPVVVRLLGGGAVEGVLTEVGGGWLLVEEGPGGAALVPLPAVVALAGLSAWSGVPGAGGRVLARLGLGSALRAVARDRLPLRLGLVDGSTLAGTLERVGADFVEVTEHPAGEPRRRAGVTGVRTVPFAALAVVRSGP